MGKIEILFAGRRRGLKKTGILQVCSDCYAGAMVRESVIRQAILMKPNGQY